MQAASLFGFFSLIPKSRSPKSLPSGSPARTWAGRTRICVVSHRFNSLRSRASSLATFSFSACLTAKRSSAGSSSRRSPSASSTRAHDFRLQTLSLYAKYYGKDHPRPQELREFVYGIPEIHRDRIRHARWVACGGCNATAVHPRDSTRFIARISSSSIAPSSRSKRARAKRDAARQARAITLNAAARSAPSRQRDTATPRRSCNPSRTASPSTCISR